MAEDTFRGVWAGSPLWAGGHVDTVLQRAVDGEVRIFDLAVRLERGMARHPHHPPYEFEMVKRHGPGGPYKNGVTAANERFAMGAHVGTHMDGFGHVACEGKVVGGRAVLMEQQLDDGLDAGSIEETAPVIGPGHLIDGEKLFGRELTPADSFGPVELERWFGDHQPLEPGSILLVRTGQMKKWHDPDPIVYLGLRTGLPGISIEGAHWLSERGIIAAGSDTMNLEHKPSSEIINLPVHVHFLVERGIPIMESMQLEELAASGITEFDFVAVPLRIGGGTGSPIRPIAIASRP